MRIEVQHGRLVITPD
ncbi:hypothetical protein [Paraburkholderia sp. SIMBA_030]